MYDCIICIWYYILDIVPLRNSFSLMCYNNLMIENVLIPKLLSDGAALSE